MSLSKLMLSRSQLSAFLGDKDPDAIRAFERLFSVGDQIESGIMAPRGYIDGLVLSNATDTEHDISIAPGCARDSTDAYTLTLASALVKQIDASWSAGSNAGGLDAGSVAANSCYYVWLIRKDSDESLDALFSLSKTAPTMPSGYTYKRRIGSIITDASANIINFRQYGSYFKFITPIVNRAYAATGSTYKLTHTVSAPPLMLTKIAATFGLDSSGGGLYYTWVDDANRPDDAASSSNNTFFITENDHDTIILDLVCDSNRYIYSRTNNTVVSLAIKTLGWIDDRGKDA